MMAFEKGKKYGRIILLFQNSKPTLLTYDVTQLGCQYMFNREKYNIKSITWKISLWKRYPLPYTYFYLQKSGWRSKTIYVCVCVICVYNIHIFVCTIIFRWCLIQCSALLLHLNDTQSKHWITFNFRYIFLFFLVRLPLLPFQHCMLEWHQALLLRWWWWRLLLLLLYAKTIHFVVYRIEKGANV